MSTISPRQFSIACWIVAGRICGGADYRRGATGARRDFRTSVAAPAVVAQPYSQYRRRRGIQVKQLPPIGTDDQALVRIQVDHFT